MTNTEVGPSAGTDPARPATGRTVSPASRKFAEYIARRLAPKLESAAKQAHAASADTQQQDSEQ